MSTENFFNSPQGAAVMKHAILGPYIRLFVNKLGSTHETVQYLDGYAGPGVYGDGSHGSPTLAVDVVELVKEIRDLRCTFVEKDSERATALADLMAAKLPTATVIQGDLRDHISDIIATTDTAPLLAFIDPFGLGITFSQLRELTHRSNSKTDVIMNVSLSAIRRVGGQLLSTKTDPTYLKARATMIDRLNDTLGGDWWQEILREAHEEGSPKAAGRIAHEYAKRCSQLLGGFYIASVRDRWNGPPAYMLMLLSGHPDAFWNFNEFLSLAQERLHDLDPSQQGQMLDYREDFPPVLERNLLDLIQEKASFTVHNEMSAVYGELLGMARTKHLRPVVKHLCAEGVIRTTSYTAKHVEAHDGKGDMQRMRIERA